MLTDELADSVLPPCKEFFEVSVLRRQFRLPDDLLLALLLPNFLQLGAEVL